MPDQPTQDNASQEIAYQPAINTAPDIIPIDIASLTVEQRLERLESANNMTL